MPLDTTSRRGMLLAVGGGIAAIATGGGSMQVISASRAATATIKLGGEISGWEGNAPSSIAGETNPTLDLTAGTQYELTWENLDGATHDFQILDDQGDILVNSENEGTKGATVTITFTATQEMTRYRCSFHPSSMHGSVAVEASTTTPTYANATDEIAGQDDQINLTEIQGGISKWANGESLPQTGKISLSELQNAIQAWADGKLI